MNNQSVWFVATTNNKQDWQKIWQPIVGEVLILKQQIDKNHPPPPLQTKEIVCIEQFVARPFVLCNNLTLASLTS